MASARSLQSRPTVRRTENSTGKNLRFHDSWRPSPPHDELHCLQKAFGANDHFPYHDGHGATSQLEPRTILSGGRRQFLCRVHFPPPSPTPASRFPPPPPPAPGHPPPTQKPPTPHHPPTP